MNRDHDIAGYLQRIQAQSQRLLDIYKDTEGTKLKEIQSLSTGDPFEEFYKQLDEVKDFHRRYPNEPVENLERAYKRQRPAEGEVLVQPTDNMFTGEESNGRFLDLTTLHDDYLNVPGARRLTYLQYLDYFDVFTQPQLPIKRQSKLTDTYLKYVSDLSNYLESFVRRTKPLEGLDEMFSDFDQDFEKAWKAGTVPAWTPDAGSSTETNGASATKLWCAECEKKFTNENVYKAHFKGKKHIRAAQAKATAVGGIANGTTNGTPTTSSSESGQRLKERVIASHEHRIRSLAQYLTNERSNTRVNVERKAGMTERERQAELDALFAEDDAAVFASSRDHTGGDSDDDAGGSDNDERIYNPLKLPLGWDGKPIPFWLYKLHGLGVELSCEICGNYVYMGRRAFDKHFSEARHIYGLKCLGISGAGAGSGLFRDITGIDAALKLWEEIKREKKDKEQKEESIVQMEDGEGNVMPERIYYDLQKQGIL